MKTITMTVDDVTFEKAQKKAADLDVSVSEVMVEYSEDLNDGQNYDGVIVSNPFATPTPYNRQSTFVTPGTAIGGVSIGPHS